MNVIYGELYQSPHIVDDAGLISGMKKSMLALPTIDPALTAEAFILRGQRMYQDLLDLNGFRLMADYQRDFTREAYTPLSAHAISKIIYPEITMPSYLRRGKIGWDLSKERFTISSRTITYIPHGHTNVCRYVATPKNLDEYNTQEAKTSVTIELSDPTFPVASEEFLHGAELVIRNMDKTEAKVSELNTFDVVKHVAHYSVLLDHVLTKAAVELGPEEYLYWKNRAQSQTEVDVRYRLGDNWHQTLLGRSINERFQYPQVTEDYIERMLVNFVNDVQSTWFKDGDLNRSLYARLQYALLAYGPDAMQNMMRLLECGDLKSKQLINSARDAIELGKHMLKNAKDGDNVANLVRHHVPYNREITKDDFTYELADDVLNELNKLQRRNLPVVLNYTNILATHLNPAAKKIVARELNP